MALELTGEQRSKVIRLIKRHIPEKGTCRVGWAIGQVAGEKFGNSVHLKEGIANTIIQSGKYIKEESAVAEKDWNILLNSQYKPFPFNKWTGIIGLIIGVIAAAGTIITIWLKMWFHVKP
jgi:hypothetical protein